MALNIINHISLLIGFIGGSIIVWGAFISAYKIIFLEIQRIKVKDIYTERELVRFRFGSYILLGLEFLIAADVMNTIIKPSHNELITLGAIVIIRTILSFFLTKELKSNSIK